ncbi:NAD-dependent epimerase/dehydratase family protein [Asaia sp. VD9]|uniref:NAD-dependent epimerase/dehydratase family protein n=1 Tax=Asaia sp. VD9 TaxID=3081235 RepID=UPI003019F14B
MRIFVAGASGALDRDSLFSAIDRVRPDVVIDQLTSLPADPADLPARLPFDRQLRLEGGANLLAAAEAFGVQRYLQQSSGFYLDGEGGLATEHSRLRIEAPGHIGQSARMYAELEARVLSSAVVAGSALRYGFFYGPGTWYWRDGPLSDCVRSGNNPICGDGTAVFSFIHVEDAADATLAALSAPTGIYNIVDDQPVEAAAFIRDFARWLDAPVPERLDTTTAQMRFGAEALYYHNCLSGAANSKARNSLALKARSCPWSSCG